MIEYIVSVGLPRGMCRGCSQVVVVAAVVSTTVALLSSTLASRAEPLELNSTGGSLAAVTSTSGVLGGVALGVESPIKLAGAGLWAGLDSGAGSGVPLVVGAGSGVVGFNGSGVDGTAILGSGGRGAVILGVVGLDSGLGVRVGFGSAVLDSRLALPLGLILETGSGAGLGSGLGSVSSGLVTVSFGSAGGSGLSLVS